MSSINLHSILGLAFFLAIASAPVADQEKLEKSVDPIVVAANDLGFALAPHLAAEGNSFYSSASISSALLMAYAGSRGETAAEFAEALSLGDLGPTSSELDAAMKALIKSLNRQTSDQRIERRRRYDPDYTGTLQLRLVNAFWGQKGHPFLADYLKRLTTSFGSSLDDLDFKKDPEGSRRTINDRIAQDTNDKIRDLLPSDAITPLTRLVLTNAIYFKNSWAEEFSEGATRDQAFHLNAETSVKVPMMRRTGHYATGESEALRMVKIPYAEGRQSMIVVLPKVAHDLAGVERSLNRARFQALVSSLEWRRVALELPRFKIEQSYELARALAALGIRRAFNPEHADFSGIDGGAGQLVISRVIHKTFVAVDEKGTEAAAATALVMKAGSAMPSGEPLPFVCDQPFLFFVLDEASGLILFQGRCANPLG